MNKHQYPTQEQMSQDVNLETSAIATAVEAMTDAIKDCPLSDSLKIYAAIELAFKFCTPEHVEEVFAEIALVRGGIDLG